MEEFENNELHEDTPFTDEHDEEMSLTKEEILERSRKENSHGDEHSKNAAMKAGYLAMMVGALLCICLYLLFDFFKKEARYELFMLYTVMETVYMGIQFHYMRKKAMLIGAISFAIASICMAIILIIQFAGIA